MSTFMKIAFPSTVLFGGILIGLLTRNRRDQWIKKLIRPKLNPLGWIFGPVWSTLYIMIGISGYLVWSVDMSFSNSKVWRVYFLQLLLNYAWPPLFFHFHNLFGSLVEIIALWGSILWNISAFYKVNSTAGLLLIPYYIWVSFASYISFEIWRLNRKRTDLEENKPLVH